jgi:hypothetical protein
VQHPCASKQKNNNSRKKHKWVRERYPKRDTEREEFEEEEKDFWVLILCLSN